MSKWNQWSMSPANVSLIESLIDAVFALGYEPVSLVNAVQCQIEVAQSSTASRVGSLRSDPI